MAATQEEEDGPTIAVPAAHEPEPRSEEAAMPEAEPAAVIGVAMPPPNSSVSEDEAAVIPKRSMGPALPQGLSREKLESVAEAYRANQEADDDDEGPMLPGEHGLYCGLSLGMSRVIRCDELGGCGCQGSIRWRG